MRAARCIGVMPRAFAARQLHSLVRVGVPHVRLQQHSRPFAGRAVKEIKGEHWELKPKPPEPQRPIHVFEGLATPEKYIDQRYQCNYQRKQGRIPCTILANDPKYNLTEQIRFSLSLRDMLKEINKVHAGFTNQVYKIKLDNRADPIHVICTNLQLDTFTHEPISAQFVRFQEGRRYKVNIPVSIDGAEDCPGLKRGGILLTPTWTVPAYWDGAGGEFIPERIWIDLSKVGPRTIIRVSDLEARGEWPSKYLSSRSPNDYVLVTIKGKVKALAGEDDA